LRRPLEGPPERARARLTACEPVTEGFPCKVLLMVVLVIGVWALLRGELAAAGVMALAFVTAPAV
jgi:hypothetical protein